MPCRLENSGAGFACDPAGPERGLRKGPGTQSRRGSRCVTGLRRSAIHLGFAMRRKSLLASNSGHFRARQMPYRRLIRTRWPTSRGRRTYCSAAGRGSRLPILAGRSARPARSRPVWLRSARAAQTVAISPGEPAADRAVPRRKWAAAHLTAQHPLLRGFPTTWPSANRPIRAANLDSIPREPVWRRAAQQLVIGAVFPNEGSAPGVVAGPGRAQALAP
jgi:hypothetical protein